MTMPSPTPVIVDTSRSLYARLRPVPLTAIRLTDTFWQSRREINRTKTLPAQYRQCEETGRLDNFRRAAGKKDGPFQGIFFNDSDVYKWLEAAASALATAPDDAALRGLVASAIEEVAAAQDADGYLNTYFSVDRVAERWTNLRDMHELYCAGHLFQAAVAHFRATGERTLLDVAIRFADLICDTFGHASDGKREGACGHEEVEMALVELGRATGDPRYLAQADYFVSARGREPSAVTGQPGSDRRYAQDHVPFRQLDEVLGHAVRMVYLSAGAADVYAETGDESLKTALDKQWDNATTRRTYVTGGLGARWEGEAFGGDYELPARAYAETCAAIGSVMWNWRMLLATGEAKYADALERALYNGVLSGLSLDGGEYFYQNPLADGGGHRRQPWFGCACCPPNVARLLSQLPGYFYSVSDEEAWVHLYAEGTARLTLPDGGIVGLSVQTRYPWDGDIEITLTEVPEDFSLLNLRVPGWASGAAITVNGEVADVETAPGSYATIGRDWKKGPWKAGDVIRLLLPMPARAVTADPRVSDVAGHVALMRGPLVYCIEQADHAEEVADVRDVFFPADAGLDTVPQPDLLGGIVALTFLGFGANRRQWNGSLYRPVEAVQKDEDGESIVEVTAIPYYAWANRAAGPMTVWMPVLLPEE